VHLKSITVKGFKSFPDRTRLEFGPGVSVIVGPNGSGKSNITDAVLWALGEQSPLAVRGQTMQDVIFAGSEGVKGRSSCEVEVVIDNADGRLRSDFSEISISRYIDRSGEGVYRLNGARCRLVDVIEVLSDSGLGKEMHSVISQGRVEAIIHSKPFDRTALVEEAAGLSKHRKRRRRAQLKLERTQDNLDRALDVEREARSRLRPLKRQAEAAELHSRLERQSLELRGRLTDDSLLAVAEELTEAESAAADARQRRDDLEREQTEVAHKREQTERSLAEHGRERENLSSRLFAARSAAERIAIRLESVRAGERMLQARLRRSLRALEQSQDAGAGSDQADRLAELETELAALDRNRDGGMADELEAIERQRREADLRAVELGELCETKALELRQAEATADDARERRRLAGERLDAATRRHAALEVEIEALVQRQRLFAGDGGPSLAEKLSVDEGYETALAAALGSRLTAPIVPDLIEGARLIEEADSDGAIALVESGGGEAKPSMPPAPAAERLLDHVSCDPALSGLLARVLGDTWVVPRIDEIAEGFEGTAVTREGVAYRGGVGELRRLPQGGIERALAERGRRAELQAELERAAHELDQARLDAALTTTTLRSAEESRDAIEGELRGARREREEALERARRAEWLAESRRDLGSGPQDARRAQLVAEIAAERRLAAGLAAERAERVARRQQLERGTARDRALLPVAERLQSALERALTAVEERREALEQELSADEAVGEQAAAELRRLAQAEYGLQAQLREASEQLTQEEVRVAHVRDRHGALAGELETISGRLGYEPETGGVRLADDERVEVEAKLERLERRRERLGPVNPLAEREYEEALEHVQELEQQRKDLEDALAELAALIRETDRRIRESFEETFELTAHNFEEVIQHLFPGGRGMLRLVKAPRPRAVLGGAEVDEKPGVAEPASEADASEPMVPEGDFSDTVGIEIEVTPAGKSTKRLSLLSGGEKSLVALGFLFAVFLARPCPFYILDEVEAALDDTNIDRFLALVRGYSDRSQFIVITHQRRTMGAADVLYGVSMSGDGISRVVSRRFEPEPEDEPERGELSEAA
jgi:chromosome segregation protein